MWREPQKEYKLTNNPNTITNEYYNHTEGTGEKKN